MLQNTNLAYQNIFPHKKAQKENVLNPLKARNKK